MFSSLNGEIIHLNGSVLGFEECFDFRLQILGEGVPYAYLQSVEHETTGFVVASPFFFFHDYSFELDEPIKEELEIHSPDGVLVLGIITLRNPFSESTMNLAAPIVVNVTTLKGRQTVLSPKHEWDTKAPLFAMSNEESGDS